MSNSKDFYKAMLAIAIPVTIQNFIISSINMLDTLMISTLGTAEIAGVGLANQIFFFYILICFGINSGSSVLVAQYWGKSDLSRLRQVNYLALSLCVGVGLVFFLLAFTFPYQIMSLLSVDQQVIQKGSIYLRVVSLSYILTSMSAAYGTTLRSSGNPRISMVASIVGFVLNTFFNFVLIFGMLGFPKLGILGAAWGTVIARFGEFLIVFSFVKLANNPLHGGSIFRTTIEKTLIAQYKKIVIPVIINEAFWSLGHVLYNVAYGLVSTQSLAAVQVAAAVQQLLFVFIRGLGSSCSIMIGNTLGQGKKEEAYPLATKFVKLTLVASLILGLVIIIFREPLILIFGQLNSEVANIANQILVFIGLTLSVRGFNSLMVVGILRGGGDTNFSMMMESGTVWFVGVPLAFMGVLILKLPIVWVMFLVFFDEIFKAIIGYLRLVSKKWIHQI